MILIDGKGQLGEALKKYKRKEEAVIYHTWNFQDKTEKTQKKCYENFKKYLNLHKDKRIIFISTNSHKRNAYVKYKREAEKLLKNGFYVRLPILIGKGVFEEFRDNDIDAFGTMEIITIEDAVRKILKAKNSVTIKGTKVPAKIVKELIRFGKFGIETD